MAEMGGPRYRGGRGEPLVLLHGAFYTWRAWEALLPHLACSFEVLAPTLLGHLEGDRFPAGVATGIEALADGLERELDVAGWDTATLRDSLVTLDGLLELQPPGAGGPTMIISDQASYSDQVFGLYWLLGYQFSPRPAGLPDQRFWHFTRDSDYGALHGLARNRINTPLILAHWDDILRVIASLSTGTVRASELLRVLQGGGRPTPLGRAIAELGRAAKTLHLLHYVDSDTYRRCIGVHLNRHEGRHSVARVIFHGNRGELRQPYREGQEDQLAALGFAHRHRRGVWRYGRSAGGNGPLGNPSLGGARPLGNRSLGDNGPVGNRSVGNRPLGGAEPLGNRSLGNRPVGGTVPLGDRSVGNRSVGGTVPMGNGSGAPLGHPLGVLAACGAQSSGRLDMSSASRSALVGAGSEHAPGAADGCFGQVSVDVTLPPLGVLPAVFCVCFGAADVVREGVAGDRSLGSCLTAA